MSLQRQEKEKAKKKKIISKKMNFENVLRTVSI